MATAQSSVAHGGYSFDDGSVRAVGVDMMRAPMQLEPIRQQHVGAANNQLMGERRRTFDCGLAQLDGTSAKLQRTPSAIVPHRFL